MTFKVINNIVGRDGFILSLLVFGAYPYIIIDLSPSLSQVQ